MNQSRSDANGLPDAISERELRAVASLLRGLPDPEPPADLVDRVMARVAEREARPRVLRGVFARPGIGLALAAGVAGLAVLAVSPQGLVPGAEQTVREQPLKPSVARIIAMGTAPDADVERTRRPVRLPFASAAVADPMAVAFFENTPEVALGERTTPLSLMPASDLMDRRLDRQLNQLLLDPTNFYRRLDEVRNPDGFVDRLAQRAARRGDAVDVALRLRQQLPEHQYTVRMVERMLWAALSSPGAPAQ